MNESQFCDEEALRERLQELETENAALREFAGLFLLARDMSKPHEGAVWSLGYWKPLDESQYAIPRFNARMRLDDDIFDRVRAVLAGNGPVAVGPQNAAEAGSRSNGAAGGVL